MLHTADPNLRNVAIIAHVDHGKTTLVDSLLAYCGSMELDRSEADCVLDSDPLEKERGITIIQNCAVTYRPRQVIMPTDLSHQHHRHAGHAIRRGRACLEDGRWGTATGHAFEERAADPLRDGQGIELDHPIIVVINSATVQMQASGVINEVFDLLVAWCGDERLDFPVIYLRRGNGPPERCP